jgi:hypothetical protein
MPQSFGRPGVALDDEQFLSNEGLKGDLKPPNLLLSYGRECLKGERITQNGGILEQRPICGLERIKARCDEAIERVGHVKAILDMPEGEQAERFGRVMSRGAGSPRIVERPRSRVAGRSQVGPDPCTLLGSIIRSTSCWHGT